MGYNPPHFALPNNFQFHSVAPTNAPQKEWSDGLIKFLKFIQDDYILIMLEDYWIQRPVDTRSIEVCLSYMEMDNRVLRFDLTGDTMHCNGDCRDAINFGFLNYYDVVEKPPDKSYRMSFQAGIWNSKLLLSLLKNGMTPWEVETQTVVPNHILILGTKQWPLRYVNAVWKGELDIKEISYLHPDDYKLVESTFPENMPRRKYE